MRSIAWLALLVSIAGCGDDDAATPGTDAGTGTRDAGAGAMDGGIAPAVDAGTPLGSDAGVIVPLVCTTQCRYVRQGAPAGGSGLDWASAYPDLPTDLERGLVYFVAAGTYGSHDFEDTVDGTRLITVLKATPGDHGTDTGWSDAYGTGVANLGPVEFHRSFYVLDGRTGGGRASWRAGHGFEIDVSSGGYAITVGDPFGSMEEREQDRTDITVRHVEVVGTRVPCNDVGGGGVSLGSGLDGHSRITLSHLWIHDLAIQMQGALLHDALVEQSVFERNASSDACHSEGWAAWGPSDHVVVRDNIWSDLEGTAFIAIGNAYQWDVYDNVFMCTPGAVTCGVGNGVIGTTDHDYETTSDWRIHHNVFIGVTNGSAALDLDSPAGPPAMNDVAYNNIFVGNTGGVSFSSAAHDYNWFFGNGDDAALVSDEAHGELGTGNPFVDSAGDDFHLVAPTSAGMTLPAPFDVDPEGRPRGADGAWDRGIFEHALTR